MQSHKLIGAAFESLLIVSSLSLAFSANAARGPVNPVSAQAAPPLTATDAQIRLELHNSAKNDQQDAVSKNTASVCGRVFESEIKEAMEKYSQALKESETVFSSAYETAKTTKTAAYLSSHAASVRIASRQEFDAAIKSARQEKNQARKAAMDLLSTAKLAALEKVQICRVSSEGRPAPGTSTKLSK